LVTVNPYLYSLYNHNNDKKVVDTSDYIKKSNLFAEYDHSQETRKWCKELPKFHFKKEWNVKIIPPFGGAIIRFMIDYKGKHVSVYFDVYERLGLEPVPYFEYFDGENVHRYLLEESEEMMKDIEMFLEVR
jgi:hypothetical protein